MKVPVSPSGGSECPSLDVLVRLAAGSDDDLTASLEVHLLECDRCLSILDAQDPPTDALLEVLAAMPHTDDDEPELREVRRALYSAPATIRGGVDVTTLTAAFPFAEPQLGPLPVRLSNYELIECIGRGATGAVYRGRHVKLDQPVAVKVLDATRLSRQHGVDRFFQEMKTVGQLRHANIIRATDAGEADGWHFLVMEFVDGLDASRLLRVAGRLSVSSACEICRQAALGLQHAHQRSLVHRDVKPSNLLVTSSGEVKLLDLGIAVTSDDASRERSARVGTVGYAPPEQWQRGASVDARADLFSLGCTLYKLLTGKTPGRPTSDPLHRVNPPPILPSDSPRGLQRLLERMLAARPADRPASAAEVSDQLAAWTGQSDLAALIAQVRGESTPSPAATSTSASGSTRDRKSITRRRAIASATAAAAGLVTWKFWTSRSPQLDRLRSRDLSLAKPEIFLAAGPPGDVVWQVSEDHSIHIESTELALLQLGRPVVGTFKFAVDLLQTKWRGDLGVFFQGRRVLHDERHFVEFQMLELLPVDDNQPASMKRLLWSRCRAEREGSSAIRRQMWAEVALAIRPKSGPQRLEAIFGRTGMPEVLWNGVALDAGAWTLSTAGRAQQRLDAAQLSRAFLGTLGLVSAGGKSTFLQPRLTYL